MYLTYCNYSCRSRTSQIEKNYLIDIGMDSFSSVRLGFKSNIVPYYIRAGRDHPRNIQPHNII